MNDNPVNDGKIRLGRVPLCIARWLGIGARSSRTTWPSSWTSPPAVPHVFQAFAALLDEGDAALNRAARFVKDNTAQKAAA
jgi:hypothetical protein